MAEDPTPFAGFLTAVLPIMFFGDIATNAAGGNTVNILYCAVVKISIYFNSGTTGVAF